MSLSTEVKPQGVTITTIIPSAGRSGETKGVIGLGDDMNLYIWNREESKEGHEAGTWTLAVVED
jgi:hypothetical protein